ncbi:MAG: EAL domain-containing protein [Candidatus Nanopelagicales bacterium]|nr:EAL domain-containing protein [Candidatus Nanopelagicales bacterium]MCF8537321.1 EAL domain-containing protein [Candidatus Nanopelagicales bacterium]MCF8543113.1 EAL domain-containing protein [Candidatus Nanopelagicales bacterium]MCF8557202.1 EAL domain-containing protein [Candidatus Nanopelagicales bacterium]
MDEYGEERARLELAMAGTRLGLWDWDMVSGQTVFNERWAEIVGYTLDELQPTTIETWMAFAHPDDLAGSNAAIQAHTAGDADHYDVEARMRHRDGHWVWVHDRGQIVERADDGTPLRMVGTHEDITERVERERSLREAGSIFRNSLEGIAMMDADEVITSVNPAFTTITGWPAGEIVGVSLNDIRTHSTDPAESARLREITRSETGLRVQRDFLRPDGTQVPVLLSVSRVLDNRGEITGFVAQLADLGERVQQEQERLDRVLYFDQTTGLPNRRSFRDQLTVELRSLRMTHRTSALLLLNLDGFKSINDAFGHEAGELVMAIISDRLRSRLQPSDVIARVAGDEFAILLGGILSLEGAESTAQALLDALADVCHVPGAGDVYVTACVGALALPEGAATAEQALQRATAALHAAKSAGPGSLRHHVEDFVAETRERVVRVAQLRQGWLDGEFRLDYQPFYEVSTGELKGAEALMRWNSSLLGPVPPSEFIPIAEEVGLIGQLGSWAIEEACRQGAAWRRDGLDLCVSVNVSAQQLVTDGFVSLVQHALAERHLPADRIILELTESTLLNAPGDAIEILTQLGAMGVRLAIDDFGTGYSSFAYLRKYPLDTLKIDRSFIVDLEERPDARSIVAAIIDMGHHLDLMVLAEGVETHGQLEILGDLGCDLYQGFLSSPAVSAQALLALAQAD